MRNRKIVSIICMFLVSFSVLGQTQANDESFDTESGTSAKLVRSMRLDNDSKSFVVKINIKDNVQRFEFMINSSVHIGKLTIEVYDPKEIKRGNFAVGTQLNSEIEESATGNIRKSLFEPQSGEWKVKIIPVSATGTIHITTKVREYPNDKE